jgi:hypothetical protein
MTFVILHLPPLGRDLRTCGILKSGASQSLPHPMILLSRNSWEAAAGVTLVATLAAGTIWYLRRKRPTEDELERARRKLLAQAGRVVDGMLLDVRELTTDDGRTLTMLEYSYRSAGVDYECSQDITAMLNVIDPSQMRAGFPCSVRYQTGSPQNSIVIAEDWTGIRSSLPVFPPVKDKGRADVGHFKAGRG